MHVASSSPCNVDWLADAVADPNYEISLGAFGAVGQFAREPRIDLEVGADRIIAATATSRIALNLRDTLRPIAFEMLSSDPEGWNCAIAICLPECDARMSVRSQWTAIGADVRAVYASDRSMLCYDIGLATSFADVLIRTCSFSGRRSSAPVRGKHPALDALASCYRNDVWVFETALGRIETLHPTRRHILPNLLSMGMTHSTVAPIPSGLVPLGYLFPLNPRHACPHSAVSCHNTFQALFDRFGRPELVHWKRKLERALDQGRVPEHVHAMLGHPGPLSRAELTSIRVALRQRRWLRGERDHPDWEIAYDKPLASVPTEH